jgi:enterochelin esterase-like enzyme
LLEPQSTPLFVVLMLVFAVLIWWMIAVKQIVFRVFAACLAFVPAMLFGVAAVNKYYDYYQTWGSVIADFTNQGANQSPVLPTTDSSTRQKFDKILAGLVKNSEAQQQGYTVTMTIDGKLTHIRRTVLVYLPPQYFQKAYAGYRFPAIELFPGYPGEPADWINVMGVTTALDALISDNLAKPAVLVMPDTEGNPHRDLQCLNLPHSIQDATYLAEDVPDFLYHTIRVQPPGYAWGEAGYSEGGFCAANLALQYRNDFGYVGVLSGYFSPLDVLVGKTYTAPFPGNTTLLNENTPLDEVPLIAAGQHIPQFWIGAGSDDAQDEAAARQFQQILLTRQARLNVHLWRGGGHNGDTWRGLLPPMLEWMTKDLAWAAAHAGHHPPHGARPTSSGRATRRLPAGPAAQVLGQEPVGLGVEAEPVLGLGEAVPLVREQHVLVVDPGRPQRRDDLLGLGLLHPRVVGALGDQQRDPDVTRP